MKLFRRGVLLLDTSKKAAFSVTDYSAITGGIFEAHCKNSDGVLFGYVLVRKLRECRPLDHRNVAGQNDKRPFTPLELGASRDHCVTCSKLLRLQRELEIGFRPFASLKQAIAFSADRLFDRFSLVTNDGDDSVRSQLGSGFDYVGNYWKPRDLVKDLRVLRFHSGPKPRCQDHYVGHTRSLCRQLPSVKKHCFGS